VVEEVLLTILPHDHPVEQVEMVGVDTEQVLRVTELLVRL
jgi:hypothetical protein